MSFNDYVKYLTQQMTAYIDTSAEDKKRQRLKRTTDTSAYSSRWFGLLPFVLKIARKKAD